MKNIFNNLFAVGLFALGAIGAWYFMQRDADPESDDEKLETAQVSTQSEKPVRIEPERKMPIPVRPSSVTPEELFRFSTQTKKQREAQARRDEILNKKELRLKLIEKDIEGRKKEVEGILQQVESSLQANKQIMSMIQSELQTLISEREKRAKDQEDPDETPDISTEEMQSNDKKVASWLQSMAPESASSFLKNLVNEGRMSFAVQLLSHMEERNVAKILDAVNDPQLLAEITESFRQVKRKKSNKKR